MSDKELLRSQLMAQLVEGKLSQKDAAQRLDVTVRQVKRLKRSYVNAGVAGLVSKRRGQPSNRRTADDVAAHAMALVGAHYADFGPTLAAEKLRELHGVANSDSIGDRTVLMVYQLYGSLIRQSDTAV